MAERAEKGRHRVGEGRRAASGARHGFASCSSLLVSLRRGSDFLYPLTIRLVPLYSPSTTWPHSPLNCYQLTNLLRSRDRTWPPRNSWKLVLYVFITALLLPCDTLLSRREETR